MSICRTEEPRLQAIEGDPAHLTACHLDQETKDREGEKVRAAMLAEAS
jgi:hypothetical protein